MHKKTVFINKHTYFFIKENILSLMILSTDVILSRRFIGFFNYSIGMSDDSYD
jgi:hypothetical protein